MRRKRPTHVAKKYLSVKARKGKNLLQPKPYRSWLEADVAHDLEKRKIGFKYENLKVLYAVPTKVRTYTPDLELENGIIVEVKGRWTSVDRRKMGFVIEQNPELDIRMLFAIDNKISRSSRTRYSDWCEKRDIKYAVSKQVPESWINE
jgi:hypothetical protein